MCCAIFSSKKFPLVNKNSFSFQLLFLGKICCTSFATFSLGGKMELYHCFLFLMRYNSAFILYKERYKRQYIKKHFTFFVYKWKECLSFALDTFIKMGGKYTCTASSEIRAISTTAKPSFREGNWTFLSSDSASCGCYIKGRAIFEECWCFSSPAIAGCCEISCLRWVCPLGLRCKQHLGLLSLYKTRQFCQNAELWNWVPCRKKWKHGNLGKPLEFTERELLVSSFWTSVPIFSLSPAESAQELFCITLLFPYQ